MDKTIGTNSLRGGRKIYGHKTLISNWIEETYKPDLTPGGFTTSRFVTTTMEQQATGFSGKPIIAQTFGTGVKEDTTGDRFDYSNVIAPDKTSNSSAWKAVASESSEFCTSFKLRGGLDAAGLEEYRKRWTTDTPEAAEVRFGSRGF